MQPDIEAIIDNHRLRRFAMKAQAKLDNQLAAYVRVNALGFRGSMTEQERKKINKSAQTLIAKARKSGEGELAFLVREIDAARGPFDRMRKSAEKAMEQSAKTLPIYPWCESVRGFGALGLAIIMAECPDMTSTPNHGHVWSRLGFAPYDGHAGSTWKRESWRPRKLSSEEWIDHPFSGQRYAHIRMIADSLFRTQIESAAKSGKPYGRAKGPYGAAYIHRRQHTAQTHPDWTRGHGHADALRYMIKRLLRDLWRVSRDRSKANQRVPQAASQAVPSPEPNQDEAIDRMPITARAELPSPDTKSSVAVDI